MTNAILTVAVAAVVVFGLAAASDPRLARWLAAVLYARAVAIEAAREMYRVARRSGITMGTVLVDKEPL